MRRPFRHRIRDPSRIPLGASAPLAPWAVATCVGMAVARPWPPPSIPVAVLGTALCLALARRPATTLAWGLSAWILFHLAAEPWRLVARSLRPDRPVELVGAVLGCWQKGESTWRSDFRLERVRQGTATWGLSRTVRLYAASPPESGACGGRWRVRGYLRPPRVYENEPRLEVGEWSLFLKSPRLLQSIRAPGAWARSSAALRHRVRGSGVLATPGGRLAWALTTGETGLLEPAWILAFRRWGLAHLLAVSGLHLGLLVLFGGTLASPLPRGARTISTLLAAGIYLLVAGPRPSLLRAALMLTVAAAARGVRRPPSAINALSLAVLALLLRDPLLITSTGFQLSAAATAGILVYGRGLALALGRTRAPFATALSVTLGAQMATLPWSLTVFHRWSPWAPLANLLAAPWIVVTVLLSFLRVGASLFGAPVARFDRLLDLLAGPLDRLASIPPRPWNSPPVGLGDGTALVLSGLVLAAGWLALVRRWRRAAVSCLLTAALVAVLAAWSPTRGGRPVSPELVLLDVGQGDGILIRDGDASLLLDAGGWDRDGFGSRIVLPTLARLHTSAPTRLAISHGDRDHCGGILDLAREVPSPRVLHTALAPRDPCTRALVSLPWIAARGLREGDVLSVGRWRIWVLAPPSGWIGSANGGSLVLRAEVFDRCVLLTGDLDDRGERRLLSRWPPTALRCDVLKVAHHGSRFSTGEAFLDTVRPRRALISAGRGNPYGHPSREVLDRLSRRDVQVLRTDLQGMIRLRFPCAGALWTRTTADRGRPP